MGKRTSIYCDEEVLEKVKKKYPNKSISSLINELLISDLENSPFSVETTTASEVKKMKSEVKKISEELSGVTNLLVNQKKMLKEQNENVFMLNRKLIAMSEELKRKSKANYAN